MAELFPRFEQLERGAPAGSAERWPDWLVLRRDDGQPLGTLQATVMPGLPAWIGSAFFPPFWGRGYATEAAELHDEATLDHRCRLACAA